MKRMNEVFELPVDGVSQIVLNTHAIARSAGYQEAVEHAAHAINNVDALADALDGLMEWHVKHVNVANHPAYDGASKALNAYRGAK